MTTIITRLYSDRSAAAAAEASLLSYGLDQGIIQIVTADSAGGAFAAMKAARVPAGSASSYLGAMTGDQALLIVEAPFNPVGTAKTAMKVLNKHPAMDVGVADEDFYLHEYPSAQYSNSVMKDHPLMLSNPFRKLPHGHILGENLIIQSKTRTSALRGGGYMSKMFWPMKLISAPKARTSAMQGGFLFSSLFGLPLLFKTWASREELPTIIR